MKIFKLIILIIYCLLILNTKTVSAQTLSKSIANISSPTVVQIPSKKLFVNLDNATVVSTTNSSVTVTWENKLINVNIFDDTKLRRHFWGTTTLDEINVGDKVNIW